MNQFKRLRLLAGKSITTAAVELGISTSTVYGWENKGYKPNPNKFKEIASIYGCTMEAIVDAYEAQN